MGLVPPEPAARPEGAENASCSWVVVLRDTVREPP